MPACQSKLQKVVNMNELQEGDVIEITEGDEFYADIPKHFAYSDAKGVFDEFAHTRVVCEKELGYLQGRYVVCKAEDDGGCGGMDPYPDGWHVFCERLKDGVKIDFYQSGSFTAMMPDKQAVGKAERSKWKESGIPAEE